MSRSPAGEGLAALLTPLEAITLGELGSATLLDRIDTKFVIPVTSVAAVVAACGHAYRALEVDGERVFDYRTRYFDTTDFRLYRRHVTGRVPRDKVRIRRYSEKSAPVLELKRRGTPGNTTKVRREVASSGVAALAELRDPMFQAHGPPDPAGLVPALDVDFHRATLVRRDGTERITIDLDVRCLHGDRDFVFGAVAVVEVKQARRAPSLVIEALRALRYRPARLSKYCVGVAALVPGMPVSGLRRTVARLAAGVAPVAPTG